VGQSPTTFLRAPREPSALFVRAFGAKEGRGFHPHLTNFLNKRTFCVAKRDQKLSKIPKKYPPRLAVDIFLR